MAASVNQYTAESLQQQFRADKNHENFIYIEKGSVAYGDISYDENMLRSFTLQELEEYNVTNN